MIIENDHATLYARSSAFNQEKAENNQEMCFTFNWERGICWINTKLYNFHIILRVWYKDLKD